MLGSRGLGPCRGITPLIVIDAFNVLHTTGVLPPDLAGIELPDLVWLIARSRYAGQRLTLVCDGVRPGAGHAGPSACRLGDARVIYAGGGREADDEIEKLLERSSYASRMLVVSSDRRLRTAARKRKADSIRSEAFLGHLVQDTGRSQREPLPKWVHEIPLSQMEVRVWLDEFGIEVGADDGQDSSHSPAASDQSKPPTVERDDRVSKPPPAEHDEVLRRLIEESQVDPDELDMDRWL